MFFNCKIKVFPQQHPEGPSGGCRAAWSQLYPGSQWYLSCTLTLLVQGHECNRLHDFLTYTCIELRAQFSLALFVEKLKLEGTWTVR